MRQQPEWQRVKADEIAQVVLAKVRELLLGQIAERRKDRQYMELRMGFYRWVWTKRIQDALPAYKPATVRTALDRLVEQGHLLTRKESSVREWTPLVFEGFEASGRHRDYIKELQTTPDATKKK